MRGIRAFVLGASVLLLNSRLSGQEPLTLGEAHRLAAGADPRTRQYALLEQQSELRLRSLSSERLPQLTGTGEASYQSEVAMLPITLPGGGAPPEPPHDRLDVALNADWLVYDGGAIGSRRAVERSSLAAARARLAAELESLRAEVNSAYFGALALQEQTVEIDALMEDLAARLEQARAGVTAGTALPGDTAAILAELLVAGERLRTLAAERAAMLDVLARLTGREAGAEARLSVPDLSAEVTRVRAAIRTADDTALIAHPQLAAFAAQRAQLARQANTLAAQTRPQSSIFGRLAFGWPGYEQFTDEPHGYWIGGVRVRWAPFDWGRTRRERAVLEAQQEIVATQAAAFVERLLRESEQPLAAIDRLRATLAVDERVIALREQVARQAAAQFDERAVTAAVYVDAVTDLEQARAARALHRVQLAQAEAAYLTLLGIPVP